MTEWEMALEQERKIFPTSRIDSNSFLAGWQWGQRFAKYCRYFKGEYWCDYIKAKDKQKDKQNGNPRQSADL